MKKPIFLISLAGLLLIAAGLMVRNSLSNSAAAQPSYVNQAAVLAYQEFNQTAAADPAAAKAALDKADAASPGNAVHGYLRAVMAVRNKDFPLAAKLLEEANGLDRLVLHTEAPMPSAIEVMAPLRRLVPKTEVLKGEAPAEAIKFLKEVRRAGYRLSGAEPMEPLAALHASMIVHLSLVEQAKIAERAKLAKERDEAKKMAEQMDAWLAKFRKAVAPDSAIHRVAELSGVDPKVVSDYMARVEIKDQSIRRRIEEANAKMYQEELAALQEVLKTMPGRPAA